MKLLVDTHTHTVASGHAYSTLRENALFAASKGLEAFCCTDHGPGIEGGAPDFIISVLKGVPDILEGVRMIRGCELNIIDNDGHIDLPEKYVRQTEFLIASMHDIAIPQNTVEKNTAALVGALKNNYIDVVGHPGNPHYPVNIEEVVDAAKKYNKLIEINSHSFSHRKGSDKTCPQFIRLCKQKDVRITVSSDAHACYNVGNFEDAVRALEAERFPEELIVSRSLVAFEEYLREREQRVKQ
ncbi:phosphatase [Christensenella tenuis]|jgi:putative hydrolase|uniref:Phosphatase n=1 Tax=Christensenella tenuis TaxID=2763033 RepID=A0ABR7EDN8_9FIRM|nr:phosphatase [Christensenella tenuis]MBC5647768.1 phosphatase [Christensenella tenuis]